MEEEAFLDRKSFYNMLQRVVVLQQRQHCGAAAEAAQPHSRRTSTALGNAFVFITHKHNHYKTSIFKKPHFSSLYS